MRGRWIEYSAEELAWIKAHSTENRRETHSAFCSRFKRDDVSLTNFNSLCKRNGWLTGRTGRYTKGRTPENKGKKMPFNANSARTRFKKGHRGGRAKENYKPIGTERLSEYGYLERKIHDGMPLQSRWRAVHILRWEERNGPVPEGHCLKCLDGDKLNTDPSNWEAIPRSMLPYLIAHRGIDYDGAEPEVKPTVLAVAKLRHGVRVARKDAKAGSK
ncbi:MAG: HNH endonuclease [Martelella sp.]|uniref:HNH endonuclease n=1 Tax=Martelella sp. TaxID=1969699 RepID=UPI003242FED0